MFLGNMLWSLEFGAGVFYAVLVINLVMPSSCRRGIRPLNRSVGSQKNSGRNRLQQVRNLGWNLAQKLFQKISFYRAHLIPLSAFILSRTSHPTERISHRAHPTPNVSHIERISSHWAHSISEHLIPLSASNFTKRISSYWAHSILEHLFPPSASYPIERIPFHWEHLISPRTSHTKRISFHWAHSISPRTSHPIEHILFRISSSHPIERIPSHRELNLSSIVFSKISFQESNS